MNSVDSKISNLTSKILFVVGATATGKSDLAMRAAELLDGEIICADSQTLRCDLDVGTAKPSKEDQLAIPHHMLDVIDPYDRFSVAEFQRRSKEIIRDIQNRGRLPIVVGGTGLYVDSLFFDYDLDSRENAVDPKLEQMSVERLQNIIQANGWQLPDNESNPRHLVGVIMRKGRMPANTKPITDAVIVGMTKEDQVLKDRIKDRIDSMFEQGLVEEVKKVLLKYGPPPRKFDAICYPIITRYLDGEITKAEAKMLFSRGDWQYARRQKAWFKRNKHIEWFTEADRALEYIKGCF